MIESARPARRAASDRNGDARAQAVAQRPQPAARPLTVSRPALLTDGRSDQAFRQFVHDMLAFASRIQEVRSRLGRFVGLAGQKYTVLIAVAHLQDRAGGVGINEIARHLHLSGAFVTIETQGLIRAGLVAKKTNPQDRRRVLLSITPKARALLNRLTEVQSPVNDALFACLSASDFATLRKTVSQLVETGGDALRLLDRIESKTPGKKPGKTPRLKRRTRP